MTGEPVPAVSVVIPVGSVDESLGRQLAAVLNQTDSPSFEVILARNTADAGQVAELSRRVAEIGDPRLRIVDATAKRSASFARNVGATTARAGVLAFCDGDDLVHHDWLARLIAGLDTADAVGGRLIDFADTGELPKWRPPATPDALPTFLGVPYLVSANMAIRRELFDAVGGFDESLTRCEDIAISWRLIDTGSKLAFVADAKVEYRVRASVTSMLRQHYFYGIGMSEVLARVGRPGGVASGHESSGAHESAAHESGATSRLQRLRMLKPNNQPGGLRSPIGILRKAAIGVGRVVGLVRESRSRH